MNSIYMNIYINIYSLSLLFIPIWCLLFWSFQLNLGSFHPPPIYFAHVVLDQHTFRVQRNKGDIVPNALAS